jgi:hypothetical protein
MTRLSHLSLAALLSLGLAMPMSCGEASDVEDGDQVREESGANQKTIVAGTSDNVGTIHLSNGKTISINANAIFNINGSKVTLPKGVTATLTPYSFRGLSGWRPSCMHCDSSLRVKLIQNGKVVENSHWSWWAKSFSLETLNVTTKDLNLSFEPICPACDPNPTNPLTFNLQIAIEN